MKYYVKSTVQMHKQGQFEESLPLGSPIVDAAGLQPDAGLVNCAGVTATRHFVLRFTLRRTRCAPAPHLSALRAFARKEPLPWVEQLARAPAERAATHGVAGRCRQSRSRWIRWLWSRCAGGTDAAAQVEVVAEIGDAGREQRRRTARDWGRQAAVSDFFLFRSLATCKLWTHL